MLLAEQFDSNGQLLDRPDLPALVSKFLGLYFGEENISKQGDETWKVIVDENEAVLTVDSDGKWVFYKLIARMWKGLLN